MNPSDPPPLPPDSPETVRETGLPEGFQISERTDVGQKREINEDSLKVCLPLTPEEWQERGVLCVVADGMGGHEAGDTASWIAVHTAADFFRNSGPANPRETLLLMVQAANKAIYQKASELDSRNGMGTTFVAASVRGRRVFIANVGDSRGFILGHGGIRQITKDHSWVQEQIDSGHLSEEEAQTHPRRNLITRALGLYPDVQVDLFEETLEGGEALVLCSDGLWGQVPTQEIGEIVSQRSAQEASEELVRLANERGGPDNISVIVLKLPEVLESTSAAMVPPSMPEPSNPEPVPSETATESAELSENSKPPVPAIAIAVVAAIVLLLWFLLR